MLGTVSSDLTIDELAREAGTRTSTIRMYQTRGLLPPPEIRGRVGYYSSAHLARLRVIARLQERGFSLAAIKDVLNDWPRGAGFADIVATETELATFGEPVELTHADFAALFPDGQVDPAVVVRAASLGLVAFDAERGTLRAPSRAFVEMGRDLAARKVPPARAVHEFEELAADARRIADRFVKLFNEYLVDEGSAVQAGTAGSDPDVQRFRKMAAVAVQELVLAAIDTALAARPGD
jgi:DNA-binding transcriptional MerR regulator